MSKTYVIAEAGSCHDGDFSKAHRLIEAARDAKADAVKFQYWSDPHALADRRRVPEHYRDIYRRYQVPQSWLGTLRQIAKHERLDFMCTAFLPKDVFELASKVDHFKIASFEAEALDLLDAHLPFIRKEDSDRMVIVSLGMGAHIPSMPWADADLRLWLKALRVLHCVSAYPAPADALNLRNMKFAHGFSDHSDPALTWTGSLAVAAGAKIVEAHLRLYETDPKNPDAPHAMTPEQFNNYVRHIRFAESCLGEVTYAAHAAEAEMAQYKVRS